MHRYHRNIINIYINSYRGLYIIYVVCDIKFNSKEFSHLSHLIYNCDVKFSDYIHKNLYILSQ